MAYSGLLERPSKTYCINHILLNVSFLQILDCFCVLTPATDVRECVGISDGFILSLLTENTSYLSVCNLKTEKTEINMK